MSCNRTQMDATMRLELERIAEHANENVVSIRRSDLGDLLHDLKIWEDRYQERVERPQPMSTEAKGGALGGDSGGKRAPSASS